MKLLEEATRDELMDALSHCCSAVAIAVSYVEEDGIPSYTVSHSGPYVEKVELINILASSIENSAPSFETEYFSDEGDDEE